MDTIEPNDELLLQIARQITDSIIRGAGIPTIETDIATLHFQGRLSVEKQTCSTGVERGGEKETYIRTTYNISGFRLDKAIDSDGKPVRLKLNPRTIPIESDDDSYRFRIRYAIPETESNTRKSFS